MYEPNFDETAKDYAALPHGCFVKVARGSTPNNADTCPDTAAMLPVELALLCEEWFSGLTMVQLTLNHIDASLVMTMSFVVPVSPACSMLGGILWAQQQVDCPARR